MTPTTTLVVNVFGGPGAGKSTHAALLFGALKLAGVRVEMASEFAKDLVWEGRGMALAYQPFVTAEQTFRVARLLGQVDVIVTDSPIVNALVYRGEGYTDSFGAYVLETFRSWRTLNLALDRDGQRLAYDPAGRQQTEGEARGIDATLLDLLDAERIPYETFTTTTGATRRMTQRVLEELRA